MDGNYQDDDKQEDEGARDVTDDATEPTDESEPDTPDETEPVDEEVAKAAQVDEEVKEETTLLSLARGMASGEITRDAGRTWLAENHPD